MTLYMLIVVALKILLERNYKHKAKLMNRENIKNLNLTKNQIDTIEQLQHEMTEKQNMLKNFDPFILDLTIREPCVGTPLGHTLSNKEDLYGLVKAFGFKDILLGTFDVSLPQEPQVDDYFCADMANKATDGVSHFGFAGIRTDTDENGHWIPNSSMQKLVAYKLPNAIVDMDVANENLYVGDREVFCSYLRKSIDWMYTNMPSINGAPPKLYINFQDFFDCFTQDLNWTLQLVNLLNETPIAAITFEDGRGTFLPFQVGAMTKIIKTVLHKDKLLLLHLHSGNGTENAGLIEGILNGADGIWAGFTKEAATIGHASTSEFLVNLMRFGNTAIQEKYKLNTLLATANEITNINTVTTTPKDFPEIGTNAYRMMLSFFEQRGDFNKNISTFNGDKKEIEVKRYMDVTSEQLGGKTGARITPVASNEGVIFQRMQELNVGNVQSAAESILKYMRIVMRRDLVNNHRYDYDEHLALTRCYHDAIELQKQQPDLITDMEKNSKKGEWNIVPVK